jgi:hypothetical protein
MSYFKNIKLVDSYGWEPEFTPIDELRVVQPYRLVGSSVIGSVVDPNYWTVTNENGGTTTNAGLITQATSVATNGSTIIQSNRRARYTGGACNRFRAIVALSAGVAGNIRRFGMFDGTDGAYFKLDGTTFYCSTIKAGTETSNVASTSWTDSTTVPTLTNFNTYEIYITNNTVWFTINGTLVHTASFLTSTWSNNTSLTIRADNIKTSGDTDPTTQVKVATIYRLGSDKTQPIYYRQSGTTAGVVCKYGTGNIEGLIISNVIQSANITLYDNYAASGTVIWSSGSMSAKTEPFGLDFKFIPFANGLTLVISGANCDVLLIYE